MSKISGIYRICVKNGDYYYGSSKDITRRWGQHKRQLRINEHTNFRLQSNWNTFGESNFRLELVEIVQDVYLHTVETKYLMEHFGAPHCMNLTMDATAPMRNLKRGTPSEMTREKISKTLTGRKMDGTTKQKISETMKRYKKTEEHRINLSNSVTGFVHSDEAKQKMSRVKKGRKLSDETKQKMSASHKGINTWARGRRMSDEERQMRSEAQKLRWQRDRSSNISNTYSQ